jgi:hypothetical protein
MATKFIKESTLAEILKSPGAEKILAKYNLPCLWCPFASLELDKLKIGQVCQIYEIDAERLLKDLNDFLLKSRLKAGQKVKKRGQKT